MEHRTEPRFRPDQNQDVTIKVVGSESAPAMDAYMMNVSRSGMSLRSKTPIERGTEIEIDLTDMIAYGTVSRCSAQDDVFVIGVQISKTTRAPKTLTASNRRDNY